MDIANHKAQFPNSCVIEENDRIYGIWMIGNNYKRTVEYYGAYPPSYVKRVKSLLPNKKRILHLFSGMVKKERGETTFDCNPRLGPDVYGNAHNLTNYFESNSFALVLADPPYSKADAEVYGTKVPSSARVMNELYTILESNGMVVWLSTRIPMYKKIQFKLAGIIGLHTGTNRLFRAVTFLEKIS
jgi:hypothetical protein